MGKKNILVAEDEEYNYIYLEQILKFNNYNVIHVSNGIEAVAMCKSNKDIDLVLMDIKMPKLNGHEAAQQIKAFAPDLTIIAQSAYALVHEVQKYKQTFDDYITKPIDEEIMFKILDKYL